MAFPVVPVIAGAASASGGLLGNIGSKKRAKRQHEYNKELAQYSYDKNYAMWLENNKYNSPAEQMKRLQEAGLNPNLVYGTGTVAGNTSGQIPKYQQEGREEPNMLKGLGAGVQSAALMAAQIKSIQTTTEEVELKNTNTREEMGLSPARRGDNGALVNTRYAKAFNDALTSAANTTKVRSERDLAALNVTAQSLRNKVLSLEADLAKQGIIRGQNSMQSIIAVVLNLLSKSGISLSDITANYIKSKFK